MKKFHLPSKLLFSIFDRLLEIQRQRQRQRQRQSKVVDQQQSINQTIHYVVQDQEKKEVQETNEAAEESKETSSLEDCRRCCKNIRIA